MTGPRLYWAAFACLAVAAVILAAQGRSLSITTGMSLASAALSLAAVVLGVAAFRKR